MRSRYSVRRLLDEGRGGTLGKVVMTSAASESLWVVVASDLTGSKPCSRTRRISGAYCPLRRALPSKLPTGVPLAGFSRAGAVDTVGAVGDGGGGKSSDSSSPGDHRRESSEFGVYDM